MGSSASERGAVGAPQTRRATPDRVCGGDRSMSGARAAGTDLGAKERLARLTRLLEVSRMLTSELDLSEIVHQVLVRAIEVIPAADAGTLYLVDPTSGKLVVTDSVGFGPSIFAIALEPGEAAAGRAYYSGQGAIYPDRQAVQDVLADASPETYRNFTAATQGLRAPQAAMSAPLVFKGKVLGALVVDSLQGHRTFGPSDLQMLEDFAQIAAIAIANARLYDSEHTSRLRLEILIGEITRQRDELDRRLRALDSMSQIAREGLSLQALAGRLASLASGRVLILDGLHRQRATEPQDDDAQRLLAYPELRELLRRVERDRTRHSAMVDGVHLVVAPVVAGAELLGYIVLESVGSDSRGLKEGLADSAALIASTAFVQERRLLPRPSPSPATRGREAAGARPGTGRVLRRAQRSPRGQGHDRADAAQPAGGERGGPARAPRGGGVELSWRPVPLRPGREAGGGGAPRARRHRLAPLLRPHRARRRSSDADPRLPRSTAGHRDPAPAGRERHPGRPPRGLPPDHRGGLRPQRGGVQPSDAGRCHRARHEARGTIDPDPALLPGQRRQPHRDRPDAQRPRPHHPVPPGQAGGVDRAQAPRQRGPPDPGVGAPHPGPDGVTARPDQRAKRGRPTSVVTPIRPGR